MAERGVVVSHTTIMRWVIRYAPEFEKRWSRFSRSVGCSWRVDETYIAIKGNWHYLYRAVDKHGRTVDFLLRADLGIAAAQAFFRKALASHTDHPPLKITLDGHCKVIGRCACFGASTLRGAASGSATKYLNNIVEQDHRAIKQRCGPMRGFKSFANAAVTIAGIELAHRIHKHQFSFGRGRPRVGTSLRTIWDQALTP